MAQAGNKAELNDALAALIASTKRVRRKLNLLEVAHKLDVARQHLGSLKAVGETIGLSTEMVRQFARVDSLVPEVKPLILQGKLRSVDIAERLSRLPKPDQLPVAREVVAGNLLANDVRALVALRKQSPASPIGKLIKLAKAAKPVREYALEFRVEATDQREVIRRCLDAFFGAENIRSFKFDNQCRVGRVVITEDGRTRLERRSKTERLTKRETLTHILRGEFTG